MTGQPSVNIEELRKSAPRGYRFRRSDMDTSTPGVSMITRILSGSEVFVLRSSGADPGTGEVMLGLKPTGVQPGRYNEFDVDAFGRVTKGYRVTSTGGGGNTGNPIQNQVAAPQTAGFWISGTARVDNTLTVAAIVSGAATFDALTLMSPLATSQGGTGASSVDGRKFFGGPGSVAGAPMFRSLEAADLPMIPWSKVDPKPNTLAGYGIIDAYTRAEANATFISAVPSTMDRYYRGDQIWAVLNTAAVVESTNLYFTSARARAAVSGTGNIVYTSATGVFGTSPTPSFQTVTLTEAPTAANHAATTQYVQDRVREGWTPHRQKIAVVDPGIRAYALDAAPANNTLQVWINGLEVFEGADDDYTVAGTVLTFKPDVPLSAGDVVRFRFHF